MTMTLTQVTTGGVDENINIDSNTLKVDGTNNRVGIGTASPSVALEVEQTSDMAVVAATTGTNNSARFEVRSGSGTTSGQYAYIRFNNNNTNNQRYDVGTYGTDNLTFRDVKAGSTRMTLDTSGRLLVGTTSAVSNIEPFTTPSHQFVGNDTTTGGGALILGKTAHSNLYLSRGQSGNAVASGNLIGRLSFTGYDGSQYSRFASIRCEADGAVGSNDAPARLVFDTSAGGSSSPTERMRIDSSGKVGIGTTAPAELLTVNGTDKSAMIRTSNSTGTAKLKFNADDINYAGVGLENTALVFRCDSSSSPAERMRIDNSGDVGIGVTSPQGRLHVGKGSGDAKIFIQRTNAAENTNDYGSIVWRSNNNNNNGVIGVARQSAENDGYMFFSTASSGTLSERMRVDSSGQVLIGETSAGGTCKLGMSFGNATGNYMEIGGTNRNANGHSKVFVFRHGYWGGGQEVASMGVVTSSSGGGAGTGIGNIVFNTGTSGNGDGGSTVTEKMRVGSNGSIRMVCQGDSALAVRNTASSGNSVSNFVGIYGATDNFSGSASIRIYTSGNVYNSNNTYGSLSDIKLKENIVDSESQWDDIKNIRVRKYNFKASTNYETHTQLGVIAQEVETVSPGLVTDVPDIDGEENDLGTTTKTVNYSVLYIKAVKALQEAMDRIETLETKVAALEAAA